MVLRTDEPGMPLDLDDLDQPRVGIDTHGLHTGTFERSQVIIVEFVTVTVTLRNMELAVGAATFEPFFSVQG